MVITRSDHDIQSAVQDELEWTPEVDGHVVNPPVYYGDSLHVVLVYAGHRQDLLTVYGQSEANAIVARLQYCDRCLDKALSMGGMAKDAADEWNDAPGGIA